MDTTVKNKLVERILQTDDDDILNEVNALLGLDEQDFSWNLPLEVKQAIDKAKQQLDAGRGIPHNEVIQEINKRFLGK